jgi:hypothetical protein
MHSLLPYVSVTIVSILATERCIGSDLKRTYCELALIIPNPNRSIVLPHAAATGTAIYGQGVDENLPRVCVSLVRGNTSERWLTILSSETERKVALTMGHVCLECAIRETFQLGGNWFIVC